VNRRVLPSLGGIHYAWIVFAITFITLLAASGIRSTPAVLMVPLEGEFGWSRATISLAVSINLVLFGFVGPFAAAMMDRWGIRPVVAGALLLIAAGAALTALMTVPWQLYLLWGIVVGLGAGTRRPSSRPRSPIAGLCRSGVSSSVYSPPRPLLGS